MESFFYILFKKINNKLDLSCIFIFHEMEFMSEINSLLSVVSTARWPSLSLILILRSFLFFNKYLTIST